MHRGIIVPFVRRACVPVIPVKNETRVINTDFFRVLIRRLPFLELSGGRIYSFSFNRNREDSKSTDGIAAKKPAKSHFQQCRVITRPDSVVNLQQRLQRSAPFSEKQ